MSEWWTYRLSDFVMFSARSYWRLFELYNTAVWPAQVLALGLGLSLVVSMMRGARASARAACVLLAACWLWVAWAFHLQRFAAINSAATAFAAAFALEGLLLLVAGVFFARAPLPGRSVLRRTVGTALLLFALVGQPLLGLLQGRPWPQSEVFGLAPDPTVLATLGVLLLLPPHDPAPAGRGMAVLVRSLWFIPLAWAGISGAMLWSLGMPQAPLLPGAGLLALALAWRTRRPPRGVQGQSAP